MGERDRGEGMIGVGGARGRAFGLASPASGRGLLAGGALYGPIGPDLSFGAK